MSDTAQVELRSESSVSPCTEVCAPVLAKFGFATDQGGLMEYMKAGHAADPKP